MEPGCTSFRQRSLAASLYVLLGAASCVTAPDGERASELGSAPSSTQSITYVGKQSITNFIGYGQHLQYWPLFGRTDGQTARRTDDPDCIELTPDFANFKHHYLLAGRTFSNDALGDPIGTKTRGGYATWATFTLPDGRTGRSGTFYDESNVDNANNTVNEMRINVSTLHEFCLNLVTDNTAHEHDPDVRLEARSDSAGVSLAGHPDLTFDGETDMYTFRYEGMSEDDVIKIRFQCSSTSGCRGAGLGGMMVSEISTCAATTGSDAGVPDASAGAPDGGATGASDGDPRPAGCGCRSSGPRGSDAAVVVLTLGILLARRRRSAAGAALCVLVASSAARVAHADDVTDLEAKGEQLAKQSEYTQAIAAFKEADLHKPRALHACTPLTADLDHNTLIAYPDRGLAADEDRDELYTFSGVWTLTCAQCSHHARRGAALVHVAGADTYLVSGDTANGSISGAAVLAGDTFVPSSSDPPGRAGAGIVYDAARDVAVMYGGSGPTCLSPGGHDCDELWELVE
jgi:MYXO-CTERM domain-containing protein